MKALFSRTDSLFRDAAIAPHLAFLKVDCFVHKYFKLVVSGTLFMVLAFSFMNIANPHHAHATAGINQELSFEGKIVSSTGTNITDGNYNTEFVIYTGCTNEPTSNAGCTAAWTEDYLTSNTTYASTVPVAFTSGTFQVNLGAICSFSGGSCEGNTNTAINWDTYPLYVSINVGTTSACATSFSSCGGGTGAMNPYILLTSSPYALNAANADSLGGVAASSYAQLASSNTWTGTNTFQPSTDITSMVVDQNSSGSFGQDVFDVKGSSGGTNNFIQVTSTAANAGAVNIAALGSGNGVSIQAGSTGTIAVGTTAQSETITIGTQLTNTGNTQTINIGSTSLAGTTNVNIGASGTANGTTNISGGTSVTVGTGVTNETIQDSGDTIQTTTNSATALEVQNSVGAPIFLVDTTSTSPNGGQVNYLNYPGFEVGTVGSLPTGWTNVGTGTTTLNNNRQHVFGGLYSASLATTTTAGAGLSTTSFAATPPTGAETYIVSFYAEVASGTMPSTSFTVSITSGSAFTCSPAAGITLNTSSFQRLTCNVTTTAGTMSAFQITQNDTTARTIYFDSIQVQLNSFNGSTITTPTPYQIGAIQLRGVIQNPISIVPVGDSANVLQVANSIGTNVFQVSTSTTSDSQIILGLGTTGEATPVELVLDSGSSATDPATVANGAMYYNSSKNQFRCGEWGVWMDCIGGLVQSNSALGSAVNTCTTACAALYSAAGTSLSANYCQAGRTLHIYASGVMSTFSTAPTLSLAFYQGTTSTSDATDTLIGTATPAYTTTASLANAPWSVQYTIVCFSTTTWEGSGTLTVLNSTTATAVNSVYTFAPSASATAYTTTASNIYLFPIWGTSKSTNTITLDQYMVTGN